MKQIFLNFLWVVLISSVSIAANSTGREGENDVLQNDNKTKKHSSFKKRVPYCYMIKLDKSNEIISKSIISVKSGSILLPYKCCISLFIYFNSISFIVGHPALLAEVGWDILFA